MSVYDDWKLASPDDEEHTEDSAPHGLCEMCETPLEHHDDVGEFCPTCNPPLLEENIPVRVSFNIETPRRKGDLGVVTVLT